MWIKKMLPSHDTRTYSLFWLGWVGYEKSARFKLWLHDQIFLQVDETSESLELRTFRKNSIWSSRGKVSKRDGLLEKNSQGGMIFRRDSVHEDGLQEENPPWELVGEASKSSFRSCAHLKCKQSGLWILMYTPTIKLAVIIWRNDRKIVYK